MYAILTLFSGFIAVMFVATALSSIANAMKEEQAARKALANRMTF